MNHFRNLVLPVSIIIGIFFHSYFDRLTPLIPSLIFALLFISFSNIELKKMKVSMFHFQLILFQLIFSLGIYFILKLYDESIAQGVLVTVLTPTATSAVVIAVMLGANLNTMVSYTLFCNLIVAIVAPILFSFIGEQINIGFWASFWLIFKKVFPILVLPLFFALAIKYISPRTNRYIAKHQNISFYIWAVSLTIVVGRTIDFIYKQGTSKIGLMIMMGIISIVLCFIQFSYGRYIGKKYGDVVAGGQSLGQKNTVLAIWMAQSYLLPLSSVIPALYVIWQNLFNSYQLWKKNRKKG